MIETIADELSDCRRKIRYLAKHFLGIDGGQTTTVAAIVNENGEIVGVGLGGPANHIHEPGGVDRIMQSLRDSISLAQIGASLQGSFSYSYLGMTGASAEMKSICQNVMEAQSSDFQLGHDTEIALTSVTLGGPGLAVIAGTGSAALGRDIHGNDAKAGGWGYIFGDEGSAYWIAVEALRAIGYSLDGSIPETTLLPAFLNHFSVESFGDIHRLVYSGELARVDIADLAKLVHQNALQEDMIAQNILQRAGMALARLPLAILPKLDFGDMPVLIGIVGGVWKSDGFVRNTFEHCIREQYPQVNIVVPTIPAAAASAILAMKFGGIEITAEILGNVVSSVSRYPQLKR